ncbi:MAG: DUF3179 domain-containing protein [Chitinophagaceae bacterium]|nr:MAG: DUF3179 domain-containing protein [Chitinophagaceae bacterium]
MRKIILVSGLILLFAAEILRVYFIMPFPGSQQSDTIGIAYWLGNNITWIRLVLLALILYPVIYSLRHNTKWKTVLLLLVLALYATVFYFVNFRFEADKMFLQPVTKTFFTRTDNKVDSTKLVIGVQIGGEAKAYPVEIIGYHHQVRDSIGNTAVMVTYCTVCRTGRVYSPIVNGQPEVFRLVGMDHFNAMFEDSSTKSWWQQATGEAITGKLKGHRLPEIASRQMSLASWIRLYPDTKVMQPDQAFLKKYEGLKGYDDGSIEGGLEHRDSSSWADKSWVIGVEYRKGKFRAYDWNRLVQEQIIQDSIPATPVLLVLENDHRSFHVFSPVVNGQRLVFAMDPDKRMMTDRQTGSSWTIDGRAVFGVLNGHQLDMLPAYQEFWHSWKQFHPDTEK